MKKVYALPQCFMLKRNGLLVLLVGKIVDDFLLAGTDEAIAWFSQKIHKRFTIGTEACPPHPLRFNGAIIQQAEDFYVQVSMEEFASNIHHLQVPREHRRQANAPATPAEFKSIQTLAGQMNWLGHTAAPHYSFAASYLQQTVGDLRVKHLTQANGVLTKAKRVHSLSFSAVPKLIRPPT